MEMESIVNYNIRNELKSEDNKFPPIAGKIFLRSSSSNLSKLLCLFMILDSEEYFDDSDVDDVDGGEFTPMLTHGIDDGLIVGVRNNVPKRNPDRRIVPAGYYPQWPTYYPEVDKDMFLNDFKVQTYVLMISGG